MQRLLNLLPLKTERLVLSPTTTKDIDLILKMDKQEATQAYLGGIKEYTKEERIKFLKKKEGRSITVYLEETPIGFAGLRLEQDAAELSYIFDEDYWKHGYCQEACEKLLQVGFEELGLSTITANTKEENIRSIRVLEKLGFTRQGRFKEDFILYKITKEEWRKRK